MQHDIRHNDTQGKDGNQGYAYDGFKFFAHGSSFLGTKRMSDQLNL
jgi:hypothetical protein